MLKSFTSKFFVFLFMFILSGCGGDPALKESDANNLPPDKLSELELRAEKEPNNAAVFNELALFYLSRENFNDALHNINKSLILEPLNTVYYVTLSDIYLMMGDAERAQLTLYRAMDLEPNNALIYVHVGRIQVYLEDYPRAFENLRRALELDRNNSNAYFWRGLAFLENSDTLRAISDWQLAVANDPESFYGYFQLGLLMAERRDRFAFDYLNHALMLAPPDPKLLYDIGMAFQEINRFTKSIETYERIISIDSCFYLAWYNIGYINLVEMEEYEKAIEDFSRAIECKNDYAESFYNRGLAHEILENFSDARKDYQEALRIHVNFTKAIEALNRLDKIQFDR